MQATKCTGVMYNFHDNVYKNHKKYKNGHYFDGEVQHITRKGSKTVQYSNREGKISKRKGYTKNINYLYRERKNF